MENIIYKKVNLECDNEKAFRMFTSKGDLESWLCMSANVEPKLGGKYELCWDVSDIKNNSTLGCRIKAIDYNKLLVFDWKGPKEFAETMNNIYPLTLVTVLFYPLTIDGKKNCEIHLLHSGWKKNDDWSRCREWFDTAWQYALDKLTVEIHNKHTRRMW